MGYPVSPRVGGDLPGLAQQLAVEALRGNADVLERSLYAAVDFDLRAAIPTRPKDLSRAAGARKGWDEVLPGADKNIQPPAERRDLSGERGERMGEPPAAGPPEPARADGRLVVDVDEKRRFFRGGPDGGLIVEPQIAAQPDEDGAAHGAPTPMG